MTPEIRGCYKIIHTNKTNKQTKCFACVKIVFAKHNSKSLCSSYFIPGCDSVTHQPDSFANEHLTLAAETMARQHENELLSRSVRWVQSSTQVGLCHGRCVIGLCQVKKALAGQTSGSSHASTRHGWSACSTHFQAGVIHFWCLALLNSKQNVTRM